MTCAPLDACHVAGVCNAASGTCSNPNATNGTLCGAPSQAQACSAGACVAEPVCTASETLCKGICVSTQSDSSNCGSCGAGCASGSSCVLGACVSRNVMASCGVPAGSMSVLASPEGVTSYLPNGSWGGLGTGIQRVVLEGTTLSSQTIPTPTVINSCASNWVTGETVCVANGTEVYIIHGTAIVATLTSGATGYAQSSGGYCQTCGVAIDAVANKAILEVGLVLPDGQDQAGYQFLDLGTRTFSPPIPAAIDPTRLPAVIRRISEDVAVDPIRQLVLSPNELADFQILKYAGAPASFSNVFPAPSPGAATAHVRFGGGGLHDRHRARDRRERRGDHARRSESGGVHARITRRLVDRAFQSSRAGGPTVVHAAPGDDRARGGFWHPSRARRDRIPDRRRHVCHHRAPRHGGQWHAGRRGLGGRAPLEGPDRSDVAGRRATRTRSPRT